ncbi:MAG: c-type cytochrome [Thermoleophilia bacterium]
MARKMMYAAVTLALVTAIVALVAGCGGTTTTTTTAGVTTTAAGGATTLAGSEIFASVCAACHGVDGTGNTGPDLTALSTLTKERIVDQVTNGGTSMPAYGGQMSAEEIDVVADYVLSDIVK